VAKVVLALAGRQHGVVAHRQLRARAISRDEIRGLTWVRPLHRGVSFAGAGRPSRDAVLIAAVLAIGDDACLFARSAAEALGQAKGIEGDVHVACPRDVRSRRGIRVHAVTLEGHEVGTIRGIPVTEPNRTIADFAAGATRREIEQAIDQAAYDKNLSLSKLHTYAERKHPGSRLLRQVLAEHRPGTTITRSELEEAFLRLVDAHHLPRPDGMNRKHVLPSGRRIRIDALYAGAALAIELDGRDGHTRARDFQRDRERDRGLILQGFRPVRYTHADLTRHDARTAAEIRGLLGDSDVMGRGAA